MRVLVCGGREFQATDWLFSVMRELHRKHHFTAVIHGGARGADSLSGVWGLDADVPVVTFRADWNKHGRAAGAIRNQQMLTEGKPDLVVAFPGGRGTADMMRRARAAGIPVEEPATWGLE